MKHRLRLFAPWLCAAAAFIPCAPAAPRIVWVSDLLPVNSGTSDNSGGSVGVFGPGAGPYADEEFVGLLTAAGYQVDRYNPPDGGAAVPDDEVAILNGYDLVILARALNSGGFDTLEEALPWNTKIDRQPDAGALLQRLGLVAGQHAPRSTQDAPPIPDLLAKPRGVEDGESGLVSRCH